LHVSAGVASFQTLDCFARRCARALRRGWIASQRHDGLLRVAFDGYDDNIVGTRGGWEQPLRQIDEAGTIDVDHRAATLDAIHDQLVALHHFFPRLINSVRA
jgi:hypothetical protein